MSRFHSSSSTGSAPGAASSNSTNTSAPRGRGYQVPQTSNSLHSPIIHPLHVPYVCDQQMELSLDPPNIHPPSNRPGNLSSSTTSASTQAKKTKKILLCHCVCFLLLLLHLHLLIIQILVDLTSRSIGRLLRSNPIPWLPNPTGPLPCILNPFRRNIHPLTLAPDPVRISPSVPLASM